MTKNSMTRKDEVIITTSDIKEMQGMYLSDDLSRKWNEDFLDEATGEIVSLERKELIYRRGTYLDDDKLQVIMFHMQTGEVKEVTVSNQLRLASYWRGGVSPTIVKVRIDGVGKNIMLWASSCESALECVKDYVELKYRGNFTIREIKMVGGQIIDIDESMPEELLEKCSWYQVEMYIDFYDYENDGAFAERLKPRYMVFAVDADHASSIVSKVAEKHWNEDSTKKPDVIAVHKVIPYPCNELIGADFCKAYVEA